MLPLDDGFLIKPGDVWEAFDAAGNGTIRVVHVLTGFRVELSVWIDLDCGTGYEVGVLPLECFIPAFAAGKAWAKVTDPERKRRLVPRRPNGWKVDSLPSELPLPGGITRSMIVEAITEARRRTCAGDRFPSLAFGRVSV
jgi:hypothetical protein